jgi:cell division protein FtsW (lipid II flippase)
MLLMVLQFIVYQLINNYLKNILKNDIVNSHKTRLLKKVGHHLQTTFKQSQTMSNNDTFYTRLQNPVLQAAVVLAAVLLFNVGAIIARAAGLEVEQRFPWTIAASFMLFFAVGNALISILAPDTEKYWSRSIPAYVAVSIFAGLTAYLFSSLGINEAGPYRWIYIVLTIGYLVFLSIISFMKKIVDFAQREEWNQPRVRRQRKKSGSRDTE